MLSTIPLLSPPGSLVGSWVITHPIGGGEVLDFCVVTLGVLVESVVAQTMSLHRARSCYVAKVLIL